MSPDRESRATPMSSGTTWFIAIGMVLALAGASFAALPTASAQDGSGSVRVSSMVIVCERGVDRRAYLQDRSLGNCVVADDLVDDFRYSEPGDLDVDRNGVAGAGSFGTGHLAITEEVSQPWSAPRVFCSWSSRSGTVLVQDVEHSPIVVSASGSPTATYTISLDNDQANQRVDCLWIHLADELPPVPAGRWAHPPFDRLEVSVYACPVGTDPSPDGGDGGGYWDFSGICTTPLEATFELVDANGARTRNADRGGQVTFTDIDMGEDEAVQLTEFVPEGWGDPRVFCSNRALDGGYMVQPDAFGSVTLTPDNHTLGPARCTFFNFSGPALLMPTVQVTLPAENPGIIETPMVPAQLPTSTPMMPQLQVTPPVEVPGPIDTPVAQLPPPTPTPTPEIGEPPVIIDTPVIVDPIEIVTPVMPIVIPTEDPELIHGDPGGEAIGYGGPNVS